MTIYLLKGKTWTQGKIHTRRRGGKDSRRLPSTSQGMPRNDSKPPEAKKRREA